MTTATAEKPTCKYSLQPDDFFYTQCGQIRFPDDAARDTFCRHCGRRIERLEAKKDD